MPSVAAELPREPLEAAQLDGQSWPGILRQVVAPLTWPSLMAAGLLGFALNWNEFLFAVSNNAGDGGRPW